MGEHYAAMPLRAVSYEFWSRDASSEDARHLFRWLRALAAELDELKAQRVL